MNRKKKAPAISEEPDYFAKAAKGLEQKLGEGFYVSRRYDSGSWTLDVHSDHPKPDDLPTNFRGYEVRWSGKLARPL